MQGEKKVVQKLTFRQIQYNFFYINTLLENYKRRSLYWIGLLHCLPLALRPSEVFLRSCEILTNIKIDENGQKWHCLWTYPKCFRKMITLEPKITPFMGIWSGCRVVRGVGFPEWLLCPPGLLADDFGGRDCPNRDHFWNF